MRSLSGRVGLKSMGRRLRLTAAAHAAVVAIAALALIGLQHRMEVDLERATAEFVEEQWIADRASSALMRQLVAATAYQHNPGPGLRAQFQDAGEEVYRELHQYLLRDLTFGQRLQLEAVKSEHQQLEVAAARALELAGRGRTGASMEAAWTMAGHGLALQAAIQEFLELREAELGQVRLQQARTFRFLYAGGAGAALLLVLSSLFWGRFLQRRLARPLAQLGAAAERIGAGDLSVRVPVPTESELAAVASSFNQMADGLVTARIDLEHRNQQLEQAVSRLRDTQAELVQTEKLSAVGRMMAGLAHELNNPLASVLGYGQLLAERVERGGRVPADELRDGYVGPIVAEAGRARELVQNLLRFSRKSAASLSAVSLGAAVQVVVGIREYVFAQSGAELRVDPVPDVWLLADEQRLQQVLLNVVNNAFDAVRGRVPGPGRVHVRFERRAGFVDVIIEDDGPGFADPDPVFEPFYTTKAVGEGTGLGLTIVHQFMEEVDGAVRVENRTEGGARVVLTFRETVPPAPEPAPEQESTPAPLRSLRVLIVEDELPLRNLQQRILESQGAKVQLAAGGREARLILETADPDLVISDVKMPDGGGLDLYRWIEAERPELARRFLFVTGDVGDPAIAALAEAKPGQFISKPFDKDEYLARIAALAGEATMSEAG